jgi:RHS repeat-associated protein
MRCFWRILIALTMALGLNAPAASTTTYYHNDLTGSPLVATDGSGHVLWRESYRPYGERLVNSASAKGNDVWFTSRRQDAETGLVYMGARYYDPVAGRFASIDPKGFDEIAALSFNRYAYANDNPLRFKDLDGRAPTPVDAAFVLIDAVRVAHAWASGGDVKGAARDLGISAAAILIPVPAAGALIKAERAAEAVRAAEDVAAASKYVDVTRSSSIANRATDVSRESFERNLAEDGWQRTVSRDGKVSILSKDDAKYVVRDNAKSTGGPSADYYRSGSERPDLKIRLNRD